jgi:hypothetical protein
MIIKLCDACGKHLSGHKDSRQLKYGVHLDTMLSGNLKNHYVDNEMNAVSGRDDAWEVCNKCYNEILLPAVKFFHELRDESIRVGKFKQITL